MKWNAKSSGTPRRLPSAHGSRTPTSRTRGQALVEFALVAPLFFLLIFGIIEFSLINASIGAFNFAAKDAARLGSLLGRTDPNADSEMIADIRGHTAGIVPATIQEIEIFKSDEAGDINTTAEDAYDGNGNALGALTWPPDVRNDDLINADYLGVRITYRYTYLTALLAGSGSTLNLTAISIQRIEPQDYHGSTGDISEVRPLALQGPVGVPRHGGEVMVSTTADVWKEGAA